LIADGGQDTINLHTNDGKTGYKVVKFEIMANQPGESGTDAEHTIKLYKIPQTGSPDATVNFSDNTLLGAASMGNSQSSYVYGSTPVIVFDNEIFNQDIYVTHIDTNGSQPCNYYIELEQINLSEDQALVAIVKNLRNEQ